MSATSRSASRATDLVGRDFARVSLPGSGLRSRPLGWMLLAAFLCAFAIAVLRIDILRVRYALGEAVTQEKMRDQELRRESAALESLRDPSRLAELARKRGFRRPDRILELDGAGVPLRP